MKNFSMDLTMLKQLASDSTLWPERAKDRARQGFRRYMTFLANYIKRNKLMGQVLNKRTGRLYRGIHERMEGDDAGLITTEAPYGYYHEHGYVMPERIYAQNAQALHFYWQGKEIFCKYVTFKNRVHPAKHYAADSVEETNDDYDRYVVVPTLQVLMK